MNSASWARHAALGAHKPGLHHRWPWLAGQSSLVVHPITCTRPPVQGCLTHMRHTRHLLCPASGEVVPTVQALRPPPASSTTLLTEQREELLQQALQELVQPAEVAGDEETQRVMQHMVERLQQQLAQRRAQQAERAEQARQRSLGRPRRSRRPAPAPAAPAPHDSALDVEWRALLRGGD